MIDCQVSDWSDWSKCDVACGIGTSTRTREVLRPESNGGRQCPSLEESRSCRATRCSTRQLDKISALKGNKYYNYLIAQMHVSRIQFINKISARHIVSLKVIIFSSTHSTIKYFCPAWRDTFHIKVIAKILPPRLSFS